VVRVHGGSFILGSATGAGMDGAGFALASGSIVATVQYRLGVFGFLPPSLLDKNANLGVKDVAVALEFLHKVLPSFGGDVGGITIAGQSSGAMMMRGSPSYSSPSI
jgi:carboxylesterase type B